MPNKLSAARRYHKFLPAAAALLLLLTATCVFAPQAVADRAAWGLVSAGTPASADCIYILGGDFFKRAPVAAELYHKGFARRIVIPREPAPADNSRHTTEWTIDILRQARVPDSAIRQVFTPKGVQSTADEARALRQYAEVEHPRRVLTVTSAIHTRRSTMVFSRAMRGTGVDVRIIAAGQPDESLKQVWTEYVKLAAYFFTFWG